jgi:GntR family transcriptional regulator of vanillate catabolism
MVGAARGRQIPRREMTQNNSKATLADAVAARIRTSLLDGFYNPGTRLNEVHLSRELAISRTPIRAALQMLAGEGLLEYTAHKGFTVRGFPLSDIIDAYEMRSLAEGLAARFAAERGLSEEARVVLEEALAHGDRLLNETDDLESRRSGYAEINEIFHHRIHQAAGSRLIAEVIRVCNQVPQASLRNIMAFEIDDVRERHRWHHRIFEAIIGREGQVAETLMRQHVVGVKLSMIRAASKQQRRLNESVLSSNTDPLDSGESIPHLDSAAADGLLSPTTPTTPSTPS